MLTSPSYINVQNQAYSLSVLTKSWIMPLSTTTRDSCGMVCNPMSNVFLKYVRFAGVKTSRCTRQCNLHRTFQYFSISGQCNELQQKWRHNTRCGAFDQLKTKSNARDERSLYNNIMQRREWPPKQRNISSLLVYSQKRVENEQTWSKNKTTAYLSWNKLADSGP